MHVSVNDRCTCTAISHRDGISSRFTMSARTSSIKRWHKTTIVGYTQPEYYYVYYILYHIILCVTRYWLGRRRHWATVNTASVLHHACHIADPRINAIIHCLLVTLRDRDAKNTQPKTEVN